MNAKEIENGVMRPIVPDKSRTQSAHDACKQSPCQQAKDNEFPAKAIAQAVDQHINTDVDAGTHPVGSAELGHPYKHDDAELLSPTEIEAEQPILQARNFDPSQIAMHD